MTDAAVTAAQRPPPTAAEREGMIQWESLPRRLVTVYLPLACFMIVLLFPFYWMAITAIKSNEELYDYKGHNPFWVSSPPSPTSRSCSSTPTIRSGSPSR